MARWLALIALLFFPDGLAAQRLELAEVWRYTGERDGVAFTNAAALAVSHDGVVAVALDRDASVLLLSADGQLVREVGRQGDGPGEFRMPATVGWRNDTLWVADAALRRVSAFVDGEFAWSFALPDSTPLLNYPVRVVPLRDGGFAGLATAPARAIAEGHVTELPLLGCDPRTRAVRELGRVAQRDQMFVVEAGGFQAFYPQPLSSAPRFSLFGDGSGVVVAHAPSDLADRFRLTRIDATGDTAWVRDYAYRRASLPARVRTEIVDEFTGRLRGVPDPSVYHNLVARGLALPTHYPPVSFLAAGRDGVAFVRRGGADPRYFPGRADAEWLLASADGTPLGTFATPPSLVIMDGTAGGAWGVETDAMGVQAVVRYRIEAR